MVGLDSGVIHDFVPCDGRLPSLRANDLRDGFYAWHGASGRRYVASVFPFNSRAADAGLPAFEAFILIPVVRDGPARRPRAVLAVEWGSARQRAVAEAIAGGVDEWHVHLLGATRGEREAIVADLREGAGLAVAARSA